MKESFRSILLAALCSIVVAIPVAATPLFNFDVKVDPNTITPGAILDIPVYMVENRNADEPSNWEGKSIFSLFARFRTGPSEMISFTPRAEFNNGDSHIYIAPDGLQGSFTLQLEQSLYFEPNADGVPTEVDNSFITGRSEVFIGTLRVKIGPAIQREDGNGNAGPVEIFQIHFGYRPPNSDLPFLLKQTLPNGSILHTARLALENHVVVLESDVDPEEDPTPDPPVPDDTDISATQNLKNTIAAAKDLITQIKKIKKKNKEEQLQLRSTLRSLAQSILDIVEEDGANINTTSAEFDLNKSAKRASRKLKIFARKAKKAFKKKKRRALKALAQIEKKLL